jgi:hypothetical protein
LSFLSWGPGKGALVACTEQFPYFLDETLMQRILCNGVAVIQLNSDSVKVRVMISKSLDEWGSGFVCSTKSIRDGG